MRFCVPLIALVQSFSTATGNQFVYFGTSIQLPRLYPLAGFS